MLENLQNALVRYESLKKRQHHVKLMAKEKDICAHPFGRHLRITGYPLFFLTFASQGFD